MARLRAAFAALLLALLSVPPAAAQAQAPTGLDWLVGEWRGAGTMFGRPSEATLAVRPALGGRFLEFSYRAGPFESRAFYRPLGDGRWQAQWFDNRGVTFPIEALLSNQVLTADWGSAATERGRTLYRLLPDGRLELVDTVTAGDGTSREFARHVLTRAN